MTFHMYIFFLAHSNNSQGCSNPSAMTVQKQVKHRLGLIWIGEIEGGRYIYIYMNVSGDLRLLFLFRSRNSGISFFHLYLL